MDEKNKRLSELEIENEKLKKELEEVKNSFKSNNYIGKLIESADQLRSLLNAVPLLICFKDKDCNLIEANNVYLKIFDLEGKDYKGKNVNELAVLSPLYSKIFKDCKNQDKVVWQSKNPSHIELPIPQKDGSEKIFDLIKVPIYYNDGKPKGIVIFGRDVTQSKHFESDLKRSEEKFRLLFEINLAGVYRTNIEGNILDCNESFAKILGYESTDELRKINCYDLYFNRQDRDNYLQELKTKGYLAAHELSLKRKDGSLVWIIENVTLYDDILLGTTIDITEKKITEEILREYDFIVNSSHDFMTLINKNYCYVAVSESYCKAHDLARENIIGKKVIDIWGNDAFSKIIKNKLDLCLAGKVVNYQAWFMMPLVGPRYFDVTYSPYFDLTGKVSNVVVVSRDITDRKKHEDDLRKSEEKFRILFENNPFMVFLVNHDGIILNVNQNGSKELRYSKGELIGRQIFEIYLEEDRELITRYIKKCFEKPEEKFQWEFRIIQHNGKIIWARETASIVKSHIDEPLLLIVCENITEHKIAEAKLQESEIRYSAFISNSTEGIWRFEVPEPLSIDLTEEEQIEIFYESAVLAECNDAFAKMYGFNNSKELIGLKLGNLLVRNDENNLEYLISFIRNGYKISGTESHEIDKNGNSIYFLNSLTGIIEDNKIVRVWGTQRDITDKKKAEEEVKKYSDELKELNASKDKFFSIVAHDLKSPFQGLIGYSSILVEELETLSKDEIKFFVNNINKITKNTFKLVENLLEWSRLQLGKLDYQPIKINLADAIQDAINLLMGNAIKKEIKLTCEVHDKIFIKADSKMLNSILNNIISNALKFTNIGGNIKIISKEFDNFIKISVIDNGIGIRPDDVDKLFRIDINVSTKGTSDETGTGLGLVLCKELVEQHSGEIFVESQIGKGTSISFTMPKFV